MSEMIERGARAICVGRNIDPDRKVKIGEKEFPAWHLYALDAKAVIEAIK